MAKMAQPSAMEDLNYAEIPIAIIAVIAGYIKIPLEEVATEYFIALQRRSIVLQSRFSSPFFPITCALAFKKDPISDSFIENFPSKFIQHGYAGEELLN